MQVRRHTSHFLTLLHQFPASLLGYVSGSLLPVRAAYLLVPSPSHFAALNDIVFPNRSDRSSSSMHVLDIEIHITALVRVYHRYTYYFGRAGTWTLVTVGQINARGELQLHENDCINVAFGLIST